MNDAEAGVEAYLGLDLLVKYAEIQSDKGGWFRPD
jgi:hypothetical protein